MAGPNILIIAVGETLSLGDGGMVGKEIGSDAAEMAPITRSLIGMGLLPAGVSPHYVALTGGVSSNIWRVEIG
ncbi:MAG: hypothetical protein ACTSWM_03730, partial [Alphaproteobacteria bacterium]